MLIKKGIPLSDPNRESNIKHVSANELTHEKNKRKQARLKASPHKKFMKYQEGQYEQIFQKANDK